MSVAIVLSEPWVHLVEHQGERRPVSEVMKHGAHLHGALVVSIGGRPLPGLGYWGPSDVCVGVWARELRQAVENLDAQEHARYVFDEGEQGQPAYEFVREASTLWVSVVDSQLSDGEADPSWQRVPCDYAEFRGAVQGFLSRLRELLAAASGASVGDWWRKWVGRPTTA